MFCPKCGKENQDNAAFCMDCGNNLSNEIKPTPEVATPVPVQPAAPVEPNKKKNNLWKIIIIVILIILIGLLIYFLATKGDDNTGSKSNNTNNSSSTNNNNNNTNDDIYPFDDDTDIDIGDDTDIDDDNTNNDCTPSSVKYTNYKVKMDMSMEMMGMEATSTGEGVVDEINQTEYIKSRTSSMGVYEDVEVYTDFKNGNSYTYSGMSPNWIKASSGVNKVDLKTLNDLINCKGKKLATNKYEVTINQEDLNKVYGSGLSEYGLTSDVKVIAYTDGTHVIKAEYDFSGLIEYVDSFKVTLEYSDFGNAGDVIIPDEVLGVE